MAKPLSPATRRLVGLLYLIAGGLIVCAQLLRLGAAAYAWQNETVAGSVWATVADLLLLTGGIFVLRYGWRVRRDGRISDEPGNGAIS